MANMPAVKGGRSWNGSHKDRGQIVHSVPSQPEGTSGYWGDKALCGAEPGRRGYGWSETDKEVNCEKCLTRQKKLTTTQNQQQ